jgi:hypothetical protein
VFPKYKEIQMPLLAEIRKRGGQTRPTAQDQQNRSVYQSLADFFGLSTTAINAKVYEADGTERSKWENMVRWARNDLRKLGLLVSPSYGVWAITKEGRDTLEVIQREQAGRDIMNTGHPIDLATFEMLQREAVEIGRRGEELVLEYERKRLVLAGLGNLAEEVRQISLENVAAGYDIQSFDMAGNQKYIEVKSSKARIAGFEITANELSVARESGDRYFVYKVMGVGEATPEIMEIQNPAALIDVGKLHLRPIQYAVSLGETFEQS